MRTGWQASVPVCLLKNRWLSRSNCIGGERSLLTLYPQRQFQTTTHLFFSLLLGGGLVAASTGAVLLVFIVCIIARIQYEKIEAYRIAKEDCAEIGTIKVCTQRTQQQHQQQRSQLKHSVGWYMSYSWISMSLKSILAFILYLCYLLFLNDSLFRKLWLM